MKASAVHDCLAQCLFQLVRLAPAGGLFPAVRIMDGEILGPSETMFVTALVLVMLAECRGFAGEKDDGAAFDAILRAVWKSRSSDCTWNYWPRGAASYASEPYPDDMDDTFMALSAVALWRPALVQRRGKKITALLDHERTREGLYRTWIGVEPRQNDIDPIVNATILRYQKITGAEDAALKKTLADMAAGGLASDYYSSQTYMAYALAKAGVRTELPFVKEGAARIGTACEAALRASALMMGGTGDQPTIEALLDLVIQSRDRSALYPIYRERVLKDGAAIEIASPALSLAACAEACALYLKHHG